MITMYSKDSCSQCKQAEMLMKMKGMEFEVKKLGIDYELEDLKLKAPDQKQFPVLFDSEGLIGGLTELKVSLS